MSRVPKWLLFKEWLTYADVLKIQETAPNYLEYALAQDFSEEIRNIYRFTCAISPDHCCLEVKEYRLENTARQKMRTHLKEHIQMINSEVQQKDFKTKNQMFKGTKIETKKHKSSVVTSKETPTKKLRISKKDKEPILKKPKAKKTCFTRLKHSKEDKKSKVPFTEAHPLVDSDEHVSSAESFNSENGELFNSDTFNNEKIELKKENLSSEDIEENETKNCETQTVHVGKEQETFQYKVATKLFAVDRSQWGTVEKTLDDIVDSENPSECLSQEDKNKILEGMRQWMDSVKIYDKQIDSRAPDPLTQAEKSFLGSLTLEDWKNLEDAQDLESKLKLTVYARYLLREYESLPRKLKPKHCQHCGRNYTASTSLYTHLVSLSGIRFWVCSKCQALKKEDATFTRKHSLQYHILKEVGIPRYRCTQPGCNKTHNHTHHQKSHARQHSGEKYYICQIEGCKGKFSNRNTYSRHLLQFHSVELTRNNELQEIDENEAKSKVMAARYKARERSKCKRQQSSESVSSCSKELVYPKKAAMNEHFLTQSQEANSQINLENFTRPSTSKLSSGKVQDVKNTAALEEKQDNLHNLNLLAALSGICIPDNSVKNNKENYEKDDTFNSGYIMNNEEIIKDTFDLKKHSNLLTSKIPETKMISKEHNNDMNIEESSCAQFKYAVISDQENNSSSNSEISVDIKANNQKVLSLPSCTESFPASQKFNIVQKTLILGDVHNNQSDISFISPAHLTTSRLTPCNVPMAPENYFKPSTKLGLSTTNCVIQGTNMNSQINSNTVISSNSINLWIPKAVSNINTFENQSQDFHTPSIKNKEISAATSSTAYVIGGIKQGDALKAESFSDSLTITNTKHLHVSIADKPLQFKSMSTLSGKSYLILSSSGQHKLTQPTMTGASNAGSETLSSSRILPFSEL